MSTALVPVAVPVYKKIINLFPQNYFRACFAYGSGVIKQSGVSVDKKPMIDMIFVVDDSEGFHSQNIHLNPHHYSFLKYCGHRVVSTVQEKWPAKVYFNTLIPFEEEDVTFKYGVVQRNDLINDLYDWDYLYLAGRLQKPVKFVEKIPENIGKALRQNLYSAIHASLIMLPPIFNEQDLYETITNLSYNGDFRMVFGEDKNKVKNIVDNQILEFRKLYLPRMQSLKRYVAIIETEPYHWFLQEDSPQRIMYHLFQLPKMPQKQLVNYWRLNVHWRRRDTEDILKHISYNVNVGEILSGCLKHLVLKTSIQQSFKGLFTAGFLKSIKYSGKKIKKMIKSRKNQAII